MKFQVLVQIIGAAEPHWEDYDEEDVNDESEALAWCQETVDRFNASLRPGERPRKVVKVELLGSSALSHQWDKDTTRMSANFRGKCIDGMQCLRCGITGKRFGLSPHIKIDSKYKAKVFKTCGEEAKAAVRRMEEREPL